MTTYHVSVDGKDTNDGSIKHPWSLSYAVDGAKIGSGVERHNQIQPGDTVLVRGGTYKSETGFTSTVSGNATDKITFKADPHEPVTLDGSIDNIAWAPDPDDTLSPGHNVYRSVNDNFDVTGTTFYGGFIDIDGKWYSLAQHKSAEYLVNTTDEWRDSGPRYLGPGISQKKKNKIGTHDYGYLFIRLDNSTVNAQLNRPVPQISDPDPRNHAIYICSSRSSGFTITGSHLVVEGFAQINHFYSCFLMNAAIQTDITIRNCGGRPIYFGARCGYVDGLTFDSCKFFAHMPSETWWVAYADIKAGDTPADHVRKCGLDLGRASNVKVIRCLFEEFFDGILASAAKRLNKNVCDIVEPPAHDIEIYNTIFNHIWDDAWQMAADLYQINFHHNYCFGAGPSVNAPGLRCANQDPGTIYIHHNVIDTTTRLVFWGRAGSPAPGSFESIPLSSHLGTASKDEYTWPRKLYYNTIVTGKTPDQNHLYVGWFLGNAEALHHQATHEVFNNIFLVMDGKYGGRDFDATSEREIYDGNVYWGYGDDLHPMNKYPWQRLHVIENGVRKVLHNEISTVKQLRRSPAFVNSQSYYPPGWEKSGLSESPRLDRNYRPRAESCKKGAVNLTQSGWPGTEERHEKWRGAVDPLRRQMAVKRKKTVNKKKNSK